MATKKTTAPAEPKMTAAEKRKARAAAIKESNRVRLINLKKIKEERKAAAAAKKADPAKLAKAEAAKKARAEKEAKVATATKALQPVAKEVNIRLEKAAKMEKDADDHRLAAALQLKDAEDKCKVAGLNFKKWSEENVKGQSYETVRKLLAVGKADEPMLALQDMRAKNAAANKRLREKQKAERSQRQSGSGGDGDGEDGAYAVEGVDALKTAFGELRASEQMQFVEWAALEVGGKFESSI